MVFFTKDKFIIISLMVWRSCLLHLIRQSSLLKSCLKSSWVVHSRNNLKLNNLPVISKNIKMVVTCFYFLEPPGSDCIHVTALKNCESELWYIFFDLSNKFGGILFYRLSENCHNWGACFKIFDETFAIKTTILPICFLLFIKFFRSF